MVKPLHISKTSRNSNYSFVCNLSLMEHLDLYEVYLSLPLCFSVAIFDALVFFFLLFHIALHAVLQRNIFKPHIHQTITLSCSIFSHVFCLPHSLISTSHLSTNTKRYTHTQSIKCAVYNWTTSRAHDLQCPQCMFLKPHKLAKL